MNIYKAFKNHLHNTLNISKDDIRQMTQLAVHDIVERKVNYMLKDQVTVQRLVDEAISYKIKQNEDWFWGDSRLDLDDYIKNEVVKQLMDGVHLKVELEHDSKPSK